MRIKLFVIALIILVCGLAAVRFLMPGNGTSGGPDNTGIINTDPEHDNENASSGEGENDPDGDPQDGDPAAGSPNDPGSDPDDLEIRADVDNEPFVPKALPDSMMPLDHPEYSYDDTLFERNTVIWAIQNRVFTENGDPRPVGKLTVDFLLERMSTRPAPTDAEAALAWEDYKKYLTAESQDPASPDFIDKNSDADFELPCGDPVSIRNVLETGYQIWRPEAKEYIIPDDELIRWSTAYHLATPADDLNRDAEASDIARIFYFAKDGETELENSLMRLPYFYQGVGFFDGYEWRHPEWFAARFSINGHTMEEAGCGFFSTAMALSWISGKIIPPIEFMENGQYTGYGAAHTVGVVSAEQYGIAAARADDWAAVENALKSGHPVMVLLSGKTKWSQNGHYVMLSGIKNDGQVCLINPGGNMHATYNSFDHSLAEPAEISESVNPDFPYTVFG